MPGYVTKTEALSQTMQRLHRILKVRITFFDMQETEWNDIAAGGLSAYCALRRKSTAFDAKCVHCDKHHLGLAKRAKDINVYHCHNGLIEGIVPLYDRHHVYLGAIVFGQIRDEDQPARTFKNTSMASAYGTLSCNTLEGARDIAHLLKTVSESIIEKEMLQYKSHAWVDALDTLIQHNLHNPPSIPVMAKHIKRSPSFVTHNFPKAFGKSAKAYINELRMKKSRALLEQGYAIKETAAEMGYYDEFHFSRAFKAYWKQAPKHFKAN